MINVQARLAHGNPLKEENVVFSEWTDMGNVTHHSAVREFASKGLVHGYVQTRWKDRPDNIFTYEVTARTVYDVLPLNYLHACIK